MALGILELLSLRGFVPGKTDKMLRHAALNDPVEDIQRMGFLELYQSCQDKPVFDECDHLISFVGVEGNRARFDGVYEVLGRHDGSPADIPQGCPFQWQHSHFFYETKKLSGLGDLEGRVIVDWG